MTAVPASIGSVSIVIPVRDEAGSIPELCRRLRDVVSAMPCRSEVIFVDDGSADGSLVALLQEQDRLPAMTVIEFRKNFGQTAAFSAGFAHATGDVIVTMDGDLQNDPEDIPRFVSLCETHDIVCGWRKDRQDPFLTRRLPSMAANALISWAVGVKLHDYGCSLKAYRRDVIEHLNLYGEMHRFIPAVASQYGVTIAEVVAAHHPRTSGRSKYGLSRVFKVVLDLIMVKFFQGFCTKPLRAFGPPGLLSFIAGFVLALKLSIEKFSYRIDIGNRPLLTLSILLMIIGVQLVGMGLLGEFLARIYFESQCKPVYAIRTVHREHQRR